MWMLPLYLHVNQKSDYDDTIGSSVLTEISHATQNYIPPSHIKDYIHEHCRS